MNKFFLIFAIWLGVAISALADMPQANIQVKTRVGTLPAKFQIQFTVPQSITPIWIRAMNKCSSPLVLIQTMR